MNTLLTMIVLWLSITFGLPADYEHPRIEFVPGKVLAAMHFGEVPLETWNQAASAVGGAGDFEPQHAIMAVYSDTTRTIYLAEGWTGTTPAELSILVHEMVHHLQNVGGLRYGCHQERENLAFTAQDHWLRLFGRTLSGEFGLDGFTLLVRTTCAY
jgi:hypothetical protein